MEGPGQDADGDGNIQIGGDGVAAKDVSGSTVAGRDSIQNFFIGLSNKKAGELYKKIGALEAERDNLMEENISMKEKIANLESKKRREIP
jgi:hypothetical protein